MFSLYLTDTKITVLNLIKGKQDQINAGNQTNRVCKVKAKKEKKKKEKNSLEGDKCQKPQLNEMTKDNLINNLPARSNQPIITTQDETQTSDIMHSLCKG